MSTSATICASLWRKFQKVTWLECVVLLAIVGILGTLIFPRAHWVADGYHDCPVRVLVFDAQSGEPISGARVAIFRAPPWSDEAFLKSFQDRWDKKLLLHTTGDDGIAVIEHRFGTVASDKNPIRRAHTSWRWVAVETEAQGGVMVPVRHDDVPTANLTVLNVPVGLLPRENGPKRKSYGRDPDYSR